MSAIQLSVVIPVFNEEANLRPLFERLTKVMDALNKPWEVIFTNDGSSDRSMELLREFHRLRPAQVRVIDFNGNFGQHTAIMAAFERVRGEIIITLDADLQNPPEEIPKLLAKMDEGYDAVGGCRTKRKDSFMRKSSSRLINYVREVTTDIRMTDQGCMLRAYRRPVVKAIVQTGERSLFIPALAYKFAGRSGEVEVNHDERAAGESKYSYYKLIRLNFDLITGFTLVPLQLFTLFGFVVSGLSAILVLYMAYRRIFMGPELEGGFTLFAIMFFMVSVAITGIGLIGEYVGRTYQMVMRRPRYVTRQVLEQVEESKKLHE
ncbi:MAG: glycosyltransferase [Verrucomicrobiota bacterium]